MTLRALVVGCGSIGSRHVSNLVELSNIEVTAHDIDSNCVEKVSQAHDIVTTTDYEEALAEEPDCVFVCTPPSTHLEIASDALDAGSHVFIEKPLSNNLDGTNAFVEQTDRSEKTVFVACNLRFHPPITQVREWLNGGEIGALQFFRLRYGNDLRNWRSTDYRESYSSSSQQGGGIILDGVHEFDFALEWMEDIDHVSAAAGQVSNLEIDVEDVTEIIIESGGMMAEIHLDYIRPQRARTYELIGDDGMIRWMARGKNPEQSTVELHHRNSDEVTTRKYKSALNEQYVNEVEHFLACIRGEESPQMDARQGQKVLQLAAAAKRSSQTHSSEKL